MVEWKKPAASGDYSDEVTWKPTSPEELFGKILSKKTVDVGKYGPSVVLKLETDEGVVNNIWMNRGGLSGILEQYDDSLTPGTTIGLRMTGKIILPSGNDFYPYEIAFVPREDVPASLATGSTVVDDDEAF